MRNNVPWTSFLLIMTFILAFVVLLVCGLNPGNYEFGIIVFPWAFIQALFQNKINYIFLFFGFLQFPVYGILLDKIKIKKVLLILMIIIIHGLLSWSILNFGKSDLVIEKDNATAYNKALPQVGQTITFSASKLVSPQCFLINHVLQI